MCYVTYSTAFYIAGAVDPSHDGFLFVPAAPLKLVKPYSTVILCLHVHSLTALSVTYRKPQRGI